MKNFKRLFNIALIISAFTVSVSMNAQTTCNTEPVVGQTVGLCNIIVTQEGEWAVCHDHIEGGTICFFGLPTVQ